MIRGKIDISQLKAAAKEMPVAIKQANKRAMDQIADTYLQGVKDNAPLETGDYVRSWRTRNDAKHIRLVTPMGFLFYLLEFRGSKPHKIRAVRAPMLHWIDPNTGAHRFAKEVMHPGFRPLPHMRPMMRDVVRQALPVFYKHYGRLKILKGQTGKYRTARIRIKKLHVRKPKPKFPNRR